MFFFLYAGNDLAKYSHFHLKYTHLSEKNQSIGREDHLENNISVLPVEEYTICYIFCYQYDLIPFSNLYSGLSLYEDGVLPIRDYSLTLESTEAQFGIS